MNLRLVLLVVGLCGMTSGVWGQSSRSRGQTSVVALDAQAQKAQEAFVQSMVDLSKSYQDAGQLDKAKTLLETALQVNHELPAVKQMLEQLKENMLSANEAEFELDTSRGWMGPVARVTKGQPFRVRSSGNYKWVANVSLGPEGFAKTDTPNDVAGNVPLGAVMGMVVIPGESSSRDKKPNIKTGKPIPVGQGDDVVPQEDGLLFLRVNLPPGTEGKGTLKIELSGHLRSAQ